MTKSIDELFETMEYGPAPESDAPAMDWIAAHNGKFGLFIDGEFVAPSTKKYFEATAPSDGRSLGKIAQAGQKNVDDAVKAARKAQKAWAEQPAHERAKKLYALARAMYDQARTFEVIEALDNGKPFRETHNADIPLAIQHFDHHADYASLIENDPEFAGQEPYGVVGQIIPWNFPLLMLAWKVAPALAAGNAVVLKPAEQTSLSALKFAELCREVGLPNGLVNIVTGDGSVGQMITEHQDIDKVAFTGSTEVGRLIRAATAGTGKGLTLELGGKSPFIVFDDADLDSAVEGVVNAIWFNQGQVCCGGSRILVQESVQDKFITKLKTRMEKLRMGGPLDKAIDIGAVIDDTQCKRIDGFVERARAEGATIDQICAPHGNFYPATLVTNVQTSSEIQQEEVFGPVVTATSFRTPAEAVQLANNTKFGLAASIWSQDIEKANDVAAKIKAGVIWLNDTNNFDGMAGFGGYRESGYGREGGHEGMMAYMKPAGGKGLGLADVSKPRQDFETVDMADGVDQTRKFYIGGGEKRPDGGVTRNVVNDNGALVGRAGVGNRKDIRNAVEAAQKAEAGWSGKTGYQRGQILKFAAERLDVNKAQIMQSLERNAGYSAEEASAEVAQSIKALFNFAAWASKYEGRVHRASAKNALIPTLNEQIGVVGVSAPNEKPLLSYVTMVAAAMAAGNTVVSVASEKAPLPAMDMTKIFRAADIPAGVVNTITGDRDELAAVMAQHENVDAVWYHGSAEGSVTVEREAANSNLKQTWVNCGKAFDWEKLSTTGSKEMMRRATQVKNIWVPFGTGLR